MPFLAKMSAHFRGGYSAKEPQSKSIYSHDDDYYPAKLEHRLYRNKDKIVDYDDADYRNHDDSDEFIRKPPSNGHWHRKKDNDDDVLIRKHSNNKHWQPHKKEEVDNDVDLLYRRSKEKFASWDIRDLDDQRRSPEKRTKNGSRKNSREPVDDEVEDIFVNGGGGSESPRRRNGTSSEEDHRQQRLARSGSASRRERASESLDRQNGRQAGRGRRTVEPWSEEEADDVNGDGFTSRAKSEDRDKSAKYANNNKDHNDDRGSLKKRNEKNAGMNLGFRAIVDKFRSKADDKDKKEVGQKNRKQDFVDGDWRYDNADRNGHKERKSPEKFEVYPPKESKTEKNHRIRDHEFERESRPRRRSPNNDEDYHHHDRRQESDRSKRRSYAFEASPEEFDVRIQKYERARRDDPELHRRNSFHDRGYKDNGDIYSNRISSRDRNGTEVSRKSSLKDKDRSDQLKRRESVKNSNVKQVPKSRISERHSRPLTPPMDHQVEVLHEESPKDRYKDSSRKSFSMKEWYESNRQFAAKYLKEHSKVKELSTSDVSAKDEFVFGSPKDGSGRSLLEIDSQQRHVRRESFDDENGHRGYEAASVTKVRHEEEDTSARRVSSRSNGSGKSSRRPRRESEDSEEANEAMVSSRSYGRSFVMPTRKIWNYRDGGVHITDVEEGQPCLQCGETCSGFLPHIWRFPTISGAELRRGFTIGKCPLEDGLDLSLAPWPGMKWACVRVLHLYCKVFEQLELFELIVRKNCTSCKCPREAHDVCHDEWVSVRARLGLKADETRDPVGFDPRDAGLAWAPPGLPLHKVEEYFSMLPEMSVPRLGTAGERHRDRQLATQLPKQDLARAYCRHLDPQHSVSADDFMAARNEIALDIGSVQEVFDKAVECGACNKPIKYGSLAVSASKLGLLYHPTCFRCLQCNELLVDLAYCVHDDALYCERHYAEQLKPRCAACDELIFSGEYTKAMNKDWHSGHFCCWQCDESLTGQRYVLRDEHPYCIKCYESVFANGCEECNKIIGIDSKDLSYKDKHWHEACFLCSKCRVSLVDKQFGSKLDKIYCGNCYDSQFASRCDGCGEIFRAGTKKMEYKTRQWHEKCFCCCVCKNAIGTKSFIPREQEIYCAGCYEDKFATRCVKCSKIITSGGVTYKNEPWHRDCFTCSHCSQSLAGQRFTSRDDKPYCADCFGELFAKRCTACTKPITGIGGTRFISFEDRHWHNDCFICAGCQTSLVGRGFITDGDDIICPECAKQKLS